MGSFLTDPKFVSEYREAIERERTLRNAAFVGGTRELCGVTVKPLTLRVYIELRSQKNAVLYGSEPNYQDLIVFLWALSPDRRKPRRFIRKTRLIPPSVPILHTRRAMARYSSKAAQWAERLAECWISARQFVSDSLMDTPPWKSGALGASAPYYSEAATVCGMLAREYGWDDEEILNKPMARIYQYFNEIKRAKNQEIPLFNPLADEVKARWQMDAAKPAKN